MDLPFLPYGRQNITEEDKEAVIAALDEPLLTTGPKVKEFENAFAEYVGAEHAVAVSNGTAALHLACLALDVKPGDVVLTPSMSFAATTNGAAYCGAKIVFIDCDPETGLITPETFAAAAESAASKGTPAKVAVIVHLNGEHADMASISVEAEKRNIQLIEDACHALGTQVIEENGESHCVGSCRYSTFATFSTHPVKTITTGEGGLITTNDAALAKKLKDLRNHGMEREHANFMNRDRGFDADGNPNPWYYEIQSLGYNYRMTDFCCALGLSQLGRMKHVAERRRHLVKEYDAQFEKAALALSTVPAQSNSDAVRHLYPVLIDYEALNIEKGAFVRNLKSRGIGSQVHYVPTHFHPIYEKQSADQSLPGAEEYYRRTLSIPLYPELTDTDVKRVVETIGDVLHALQMKNSG